jgi:hypothetical protein
VQFHQTDSLISSLTSAHVPIDGRLERAWLRSLLHSPLNCPHMLKLSFVLYGYLNIEHDTISSLSEQKDQMTDACYFVQFFDEALMLYLTQHYHYYEDTIACI